MANAYNSKIVLSSGEVLIDLTGDSVTADKMLEGVTAHDKSGKLITGTCAFDSDTSNDTAAEDDVLAGETFHSRGQKRTGTMKNNGAVSGTISTKAGAYTIPQGYHDGSGKVQIASSEQAKIIAANIRQGVTILGVAGSMSGSEAVKAQEKTVTPSFDEQTVTPDSGYTHLSSVTVGAIKVTYTDNSAGGRTVTIG